MLCQKPKIFIFLLFVPIFSIWNPLAANADGSDFTFGLKAWNANLSADSFDGDDDLFTGFYFSSNINDHLWLSVGYLQGEADFLISDATGSGSIEELDADIVVGWAFSAFDIGVGYRSTEFRVALNDIVSPVESSGPMIYVGTGSSWGDSSWGYSVGAAYMFQDLDDDDGEQEHFNIEAGIVWDSGKGVSVLFGYRYKEYSGDGVGSLHFGGPVVNLAYTW